MADELTPAERRGYRLAKQDLLMLMAKVPEDAKLGVAWAFLYEDEWTD